MTGSLARRAGLLVAAAFVFLAALPARAIDVRKNCEVAKLKELGKYAKCRLFAESLATKKGIAPDFSKCDAILQTKWVKAEATGGGGCPTNGDFRQVRDALAYEANRFALWLSATDPLGASRTPATGQTTCWDWAGAVIWPCDGWGFDGDVQAGATLAYQDNGDGTITDLNTGLMWEKLSDDDNLNDWDNVTVTWYEAVGWNQLLNATAFAGYTDWRLPNRRELESLVHLELLNPSISAAFNTGCSVGCSMLTCSCTKPDSYWSSSSFPDSFLAWTVDFNWGSFELRLKTERAYRRAVRGGL